MIVCDKIAKRYVEMVGQGISLSCMLYSRGGLGKSFLVKSTLEENDIDFVFFNGHITKAGVYEFLYQNRDRVIVFDDTSALFRDKSIVEMLKGVLWDNSGKGRVVCYRSAYKFENYDEEIPKEFIFNGRIILLFNKVNRVDKNIEALMSRMLCREIVLSRDEIVKIMYEICNVEYKDLSYDERTSITTWIVDNSRLCRLNFRLQRHIFDLYLSDRDNWEEYAKEMLDNNMSEIRKLVYEHSGNDWLSKTELKKILMRNYRISIRTAERRIRDYIELGELKTDIKNKNGYVRVV